MDLKKLRTEKRNRASGDLDRMSALEIARLMNREDARVARAVKRVLPQVAKAIDIIARRLERGGRLIYVGTGTSGRIGALDAVEVPPTFGVAAGRVQFVMAGGDGALARAVEASEDDAAQGRLDLAARKPGPHDVVVGIAASGRTPYTIGAIKYAGKKGTATVAIVCNRGSELGRVAQLAIEVDVGPEVLTGSTRLKAGTAQKMICNMLTTGAMARMGYVYGNLMVNTRPRNSKLLERGVSMLQDAAGVDREAAVEALRVAGMSIPHALVMLKAGVGKSEATRRLRRQKGVVREALADSHRRKKR
jgi:N-acetylmuramic acid 6-phosphate etherase